MSAPTWEIVDDSDALNDQAIDSLADLLIELSELPINDKGGLAAADVVSH